MLTLGKVRIESVAADVTITCSDQVVDPVVATGASDVVAIAADAVVSAADVVATAAVDVVAIAVDVVAIAVDVVATAAADVVATAADVVAIAAADVF